MSVLQINMFLDRLHGDPIGFSVLGIFVIEKHTILTVRDINYIYYYIIIVFLRVQTRLF